MWEIPGGSAEMHEPNLIASAARELYEESGLRANAVTAIVGMYTWTDLNDDGSIMLRRNGKESKWRKTSFLVEVEGGDAAEPPAVTLDPNEHQAYVWATREEVQDDRIGDVKLNWTSENQKEDVLRSFQIASEVAARDS